MRSARRHRGLGRPISVARSRTTTERASARATLAGPRDASERQTSRQGRRAARPRQPGSSRHSRARDVVAEASEVVAVGRRLRRPARPRRASRSRRAEERSSASGSAPVEQDRSCPVPVLIDWAIGRRPSTRGCERRRDGCLRSARGRLRAGGTVAPLGDARRQRIGRAAPGRARVDQRRTRHARRSAFRSANRSSGRSFARASGVLAARRSRSRIIRARPRS